MPVTRVNGLDPAVYRVELHVSKLKFVSCRQFIRCKHSNFLLMQPGSLIDSVLSHGRAPGETVHSDTCRGPVRSGTIGKLYSPAAPDCYRESSADVKPPRHRDGMEFVA